MHRSNQNNDRQTEKGAAYIRQYFLLSVVNKRYNPNTLCESCNDFATLSLRFEQQVVFGFFYCSNLTIMKAISEIGKRVSAAEVKQFFNELIQELPSNGSFISSRNVDDTMYQQQFVIDGMVFNVSVSDMRGGAL